VSAGAPPIPFGSAVRAWVRIALQSFGGPAGQISVIHRVVVEEKEWLSESRFLNALSYCLLLPGPEAQQLVTYVGWLLHGVRGGLAAGLLFILPGFVCILGLSLLYAGYRDAGPVPALFFGLKPAVLAIVLEATGRFRRRASSGRAGAALSLSAFVAVFALGIPFPAVILGAALVGVLLAGVRPEGAATPAEGNGGPSSPGVRPLIRTAGIWLPIWLGPPGILLAVVGADHVLVEEAFFFSKMAVVTFGGAYAVLAYVAQQAVAVHGWLAPGEMLDGLGLAETTPGPLIMVVQFVGFLGAFREAGSLPPLLAGVFGSVVTTWVTFAPCFLFVFAGAPYVEYLRDRRALRAALGGVMAAVVGVVLNLAAWFAVHTLFAEVAARSAGPFRITLPVLNSLEWRAGLIAALALLALLRWRAGMLTVLLGAALAGLLLSPA